MAKFWRERVDPDRHRDFIGGGYRGDGVQDAGGWPVVPASTDGWIYFVRECSFTFTFVTLAQLDEAREYFAKPVHPSRRRRGVSQEHYWQHWYERLPSALTGGTKRTRILRALDAARQHFVQGAG